MEWKFVVFTLSFLFYQVILAQNNKEISNYIKNFLCNLNFTTVVFSFTCWQRKENIYLQRVLNQNKIYLVNVKSSAYTINFFNIVPEHQLFLMDMNCRDSQELLSNGLKANLMSFPRRWLLLHKDPPKDFYLHINSRIYILKTNHEKQEIYSLYKTNNNNKFIKNKISEFKNDDFTFNKLVDCRNRSNLNGIVMNVSVVILSNDSYSHLEDTRFNHIDSLTKMGYPLCLLIVEMLNVTKNIIIRHTWGYANPNDTKPTFTGVIGDLQRGISEIAGTPCLITLKRIPHVTYITSTETYLKFIFREPPLPTIENIFILPFSTSVWGSCFLLLVAIYALLYCILKCEKIYFEVENRTILQCSVKEILQFEIGAVGQQGSEAEPASTAGRLASITIFFSFLFLYVSYSAKIVSLLQATSHSIQTVEDLLKSRIQLGVEETPYNRHLFNTQSDYVYKKLYEEKVSPPNKPDQFMDIKEGVSRLRNDFFAFHAECNSIYTIAGSTFEEHEKCSLKEIDFLHQVAPFFIVRKSSPYSELIKIGYVKLLERGIHKRVFLRIYGRKAKCDGNSASFVSVSARDCEFVFVLFSGGLCLAFIIFVLELFFNYIKNINRKS